MDRTDGNRANGPEALHPYFLHGMCLEDKGNWKQNLTGLSVITLLRTRWPGTLRLESVHPGTHQRGNDAGVFEDFSL